jgi:serine/threonine protein kinase
MKIIPKINICEDRDVRHLQLELDATAFLRHANICSLREFFSDSSYYYLVLDYCPGGNLEEYIATHPLLRESQAALIFHQIVLAIQLAHARRVAHRDLKLQNILITMFPNVKVTDFGFAGYLQEDAKMRTFCGSPAYGAPECLRMVDYDGELADCWALGVILYEIVTKCSPWQLTNLPKMAAQIKGGHYQIPTHVSPSCADLIRSLLKVNPRERLRCDQILTHSWMIGVAGRKGKPLRTVLPPLHSSGVSVKQWVQSLRRDSKVGGDVMSPFSAGPVGVEEDGGMLLENEGMKKSESCGFPMESGRSKIMPSKSCAKCAMTLDRKVTLPISPPRRGG